MATLTGKASGEGRADQFQAERTGAPSGASASIEVGAERPPPDPTIPRQLLGPILGFARLVNPWVLRVAGRPIVPIAVVRHRGRRSGQPYTNPVIAFATADGFVISLPYGSDANWCRNVLAGGAACIGWQGVEHPVIGAMLLGRAEALPLVPRILRPVLRLVRLRQFLRVHSSPPA
jgi:deazaflavin-dependent oxidoreductase (nitroreductase family)